MKRAVALLPLLTLASCGPAPLWTPSEWTRPGPTGISYWLVAEAKESNGIRRMHRSRYRLLSRDASGHETELWRSERSERSEKHRSHLVTPEGTVWVATEGFSGPRGGSSIWMRRPTDALPFVAAGQYVFPTSLRTIRGVTMRVRMGGSRLPVDLARGERRGLPFRGSGSPVRVRCGPRDPSHVAWSERQGDVGRRPECAVGRPRACPRRARSLR